MIERIIKILKREGITPDKYEAFLFGSRVKRPRSNSDYDIGIRGNAPIDADTYLKLGFVLREEFPVRVDLVDFAQADAAFERIALSNTKPLWTKKKSSRA